MADKNLVKLEKIIDSMYDASIYPEVEYISIFSSNQEYLENQEEYESIIKRLKLGMKDQDALSNVIEALESVTTRIAFKRGLILGLNLSQTKL